MYKIERLKGSVVLKLINGNVTQIIRIPHTGMAYYVATFLSEYQSIYSLHKSSTDVKKQIEGTCLTPILDWRKMSNISMGVLPGYAFDAIKNGGADEAMITNLMDAANRMYIEIHDFYRSFN